MTGEICKLPEIVSLAEKYGARVMVDDAHGLGVLGKTGKGTADYFGLTDKVDIIMGTFSKSLASLGGYMVSTARVCDYIKHSSRPFIFSASMTPASCTSALAALNELKERPQMVKKLSGLSDYLRKALKAKGIKIKDSTTPIIPIYTYDSIRTLTLGKKLFDAGVYVNPVLPPATPEGECLLRVSLMATHTKALIDEAVEILDRVLREN